MAIRRYTNLGLSRTRKRSKERIQFMFINLFLTVILQVQALAKHRKFSADNLFHVKEFLLKYYRMGNLFFFRWQHGNCSL